jgi:predicted TIM-barrel enzyme
VLAGSGATAATVRAMLEASDAVVVGSDLKFDGVWSNALDAKRIEAFIRAAQG